MPTYIFRASFNVRYASSSIISYCLYCAMSWHSHHFTNCFTAKWLRFSRRSKKPHTSSFTLTLENFIENIRFEIDCFAMKGATISHTPRAFRSFRRWNASKPLQKWPYVIRRWLPFEPVTAPFATAISLSPARIGAGNWRWADEGTASPNLMPRKSFRRLWVD